MSKFSLAIVIPTRNRAELAIGAIRSLLAMDDSSIRIIVSDNSSRLDEAGRLAAFCREYPEVIYVRPAAPMTMGAHWDWALLQAMERLDCTHCSIHYDRKVTMPRRLRRATAVAAGHPQMLITHLTDAIFSYQVPKTSRLIQPPSDGRVYELQSPRVLAQIAEGRAAETASMLPLLCNSIVPRGVLETIRARFGSICDSTAADVSFAFRFLAVFDSYLHCHLSTGVLRAFDRSHAIGFIRGQGGDFGDFVTLWGERPWLEMAPIAGLSLGQNMLFHEYNVVRGAAGDKRFPPIEMRGYLEELARALPAVENDKERARMRRVLLDHGWNGAMSDKRSLLHRLAKGLIARSKAREIWQAFMLLISDHAGLRPRNIHAFSFTNETKALAYALRYPRRGVGRGAPTPATLGAEVRCEKAANA